MYKPLTDTQIPESLVSILSTAPTVFVPIEDDYDKITYEGLIDNKYQFTPEQQIRILVWLGTIPKKELPEYIDTHLEKWYTAVNEHQGRLEENAIRMDEMQQELGEVLTILNGVSRNINDGSGYNTLAQEGHAYALGDGAVALNGGHTTENGEKSQGVQALGPWCIAGGKDTTAYQRCAVALGNKSRAGMTEQEFLEKYPSGVDDWGSSYEFSYSIAFAEGESAVAKGRNSHAQNRGTQALANDSSASGVESVASGPNGSNANGFKTVADGEASFTANNQTQASGKYASAFGTGGRAKGNNSFKTGDNNKADGPCTFVMGANNTAEGYCCYAGGLNSYAHTQYSFIHGEGLRTVAYHQAVFGKYNVNTSSAYGDNLPVFTVGYGTSDTNRKDVFNVFRDGSAKVYGDIEIEGDAYAGGKKLATVEEAGGGMYLHTIRSSDNNFKFAFQHPRSTPFDNDTLQKHVTQIMINSKLSSAEGVFSGTGTMYETYGNTSIRARLVAIGAMSASTNAPLCAYKLESTNNGITTSFVSFPSSFTDYVTKL